MCNRKSSSYLPHLFTSAINNVIDINEQTKGNIN